MQESEIIWQAGGVNKRNYRAFLLRCWKEVDDPCGGIAAWRFTLVQVSEEDRKRCFSSLEALFSHIKSELERDH